MRIRKISVFGIGYVGVVYAVGFASKKLQVTAFDIDNRKIEMMKSGVSPVYEPGLTQLLKACIENGSLRVATNPREAVLGSDASFIAVGTPSNEDGSTNLRYVADASKMVGEALRKKSDWHLVVIKSTVLPGTTENVVKKIIEATSAKAFPKDFGLAANPEFLKEGNAVEDFMNPDRILIGTNDADSRVLLEELYSRFSAPKLSTNIRTAELVKYVNNAFLAMKVSFINMIANLCQRIDGVDVKEVAEAIGFDKRIGELFLRPGPGWGGSCWPKDLKALRSFSMQLRLPLSLVDSALEINEMQPYCMVELAKKLVGNLFKRRVAVLGLSFKPDTDDIREAASVKIVKRLLGEGAEVFVYDPAAMPNFREEFGDQVKYATSAIQCLKDAHCALIVTEWEEFKKLRPDDFTSNMRIPAVADGRRIFDVTVFSEKLRFAAIGLGREEHLNPALAVNAIVTKAEKVLLVKRAIKPFRGLWSLPGGFVEYDETVEEALTREVEEETGFLIKPTQFLNVYSDPLRSPVKNVVTLCYIADIISGSIRPSSENVKARFFSFAKIPQRLAFDHSRILVDYMKGVQRINQR